jgi:pimeloyl-ACP methyl ester carboxylesterase
MRFHVAAASPLLGFFLCATGCRTAAPAGDAAGATGPATQLDEEAIRGLPDYRSEMVSAPVFGGQVFVMEAGDPSAPAVVFVHGLGESGCRDWYPVLPALAVHHHVVAFDLPGFGRSTHANELYSPARYTEFMHNLLGPRVKGAFNLVGHSMGGALSLLYAARFPGDVQRLLLIDAAGMLHRKSYVGFAVDSGLDQLLGPLAKPVKDLATVVSESTWTAMGSVLPGSPDPSVVLQSDSLRATVLGGNPTRIAALAVILEDFGPAIAGVRAPAWILWGSNDAVASPRMALVLQARLPAARLVVLEGSGHDPMASRPAAVEKFLLEALASPATVLPPKVAAPFPALPARQGRCERQSGVRFTGEYSEIDVVGCQDAVLKDVRAAALRIRDSYAVVENTRVIAPGVALEVKGSRVEITASDFTGNVALEVEGSDLDLAGVNLRGQRAAVHIGGSSKLILSVSHAESPINQRYLHGVYEFDIGAEL